MRLALLAPLVSPIAPPFLGGAQALLADLAMGLAERGHTVTLYAAPGSTVPGMEVREVPLDPAQVRPARLAAEIPSGDAEHDPRLHAANQAYARAYAELAAQMTEFDLVHAHAYDWAAYAYAGRQPMPVMHTLHLPPLDGDIRGALAAVAPPPLGREGTRLVAVSRACAAEYASFCSIAAIIYNGIPIGRIPYAPRSDDPPYLVSAGRISPEKGIEDALAIAERIGWPLLLAGGIYDQEYFRERIAPRLARSQGQATYLGPLQRERVWELMAGAAALLCPIAWEEPFGLVACEAQAAGTPVVGYARGALPEVVAHGETGFLVPPGDVDAAAHAVLAARELNRRACRARVEARFGLEAMLSAYEALYNETLASIRLPGEEGACEER
jgi:UDP-glucose:tetrahydrobiopterin glucosyltransferase